MLLPVEFLLPNQQAIQTGTTALLQIWFLGKADVQKIKGNPHMQKTNYGSR